MSQAFDAAAPTYDRDFTERPLARDLRRRVWRQCERHLGGPARILDLGCGTGEDAIHFARAGHSVTALDVSPGMLEATDRKLLEAGLRDRVQLSQLDLRDLQVGTEGMAPFDLIVSNFGALNCLADLTPLREPLTRLLRPGGHAILVLMGRLCPAEVAMLIVRGHPRDALRRWRRPGSEASVGGGESIEVWYPSPRRVVRALGPRFRRVASLGLGTLLPPPDLAPGLGRSTGPSHPLLRLDRHLGRWPLASWISDHYLLELEHRP